MPPVRRLTAILAADVAGYSRLMGYSSGPSQRFVSYRYLGIDCTPNKETFSKVKPSAQYRQQTSLICIFPPSTKWFCDTGSPSLEAENATHHYREDYIGRQVL